jgi:IS5 family transposase
MINIYEIEYNTNLLFSTIPATELIKIIENSIKLLHFRPNILEKINEDQDRLGREKKRLRLEDKRYIENKNRTIPGLEIRKKEIIAEELELLTGRERMDPQTVYLFMVLRGYFGSVTSCDSVQRMCDSLTLNILLNNWNMKMPGATTILENVNCLSNETREYILDCQVKHIMQEGLDDFKEIIIDSTHVEANTGWPTDSKILTALLNRAFHALERLSIFGIKDFKPFWMPVWLKKLESLTFKINITQGKKKSKGKIKKYYRQILNTAQKADDYLISEIERMDEIVKNKDMYPSVRERLESVWNQINNDVLDAAKVLYYTEDRIFNGIILKASEKILSISDRSAAFIEKGNRNPVIGYKPQIPRSGNGFIPVIKVQEGNVSDSGELIPVVGDIIKRTTVTPKMVSTDDGYASAENRKKLLEMKVRIISMNGAKGKKITPVCSWNSKGYEEARKGRSAVESLIFTLKYNYELGEVRRRGIEAVRAELLEKVIVYNFDRMVQVKEIKKKRKQEAA